MLNIHPAGFNETAAENENPMFPKRAVTVKMIRPDLIKNVGICQDNRVYIADSELNN